MAQDPHCPLVICSFYEMDQLQGWGTQAPARTLQVDPIGKWEEEKVSGFASTACLSWFSLFFQSPSQEKLALSRGQTIQAGARGTVLRHSCSPSVV